VQGASLSLYIGSHLALKKKIYQINNQIFGSPRKKVYNFEPEIKERHNGVTKDKIEIFEKSFLKSLLFRNFYSVFACM